MSSRHSSCPALAIALASSTSVQKPRRDSSSMSRSSPAAVHRYRTRCGGASRPASASSAVMSSALPGRTTQPSPTAANASPGLTRGAEVGAMRAMSSLRNSSGTLSSTKTSMRSPDALPYGSAAGCHSGRCTQSAGARRASGSPASTAGAGEAGSSATSGSQ